LRGEDCIPDPAGDSIALATVLFRGYAPPVPKLRALLRDRVFLTTLLVTVVAKGLAFLPAYSIDDYFIFNLESPSLGMLGQGRFGQAIVTQLFYRLQLEPTYATVFFTAFAIFTSALLGTLTVRHWNLGHRGWLPVAAAGIAANHPYTTELFTFRTALGSSMIALALFSLLLIPRRWSARQLLAGAALFAFTLSIYQVVLHYCLMVVAMGAAVSLARYLRIGAAAGWPERVTSLLAPRRLLWHRNTSLLLCALLGTAGYAVLDAVVHKALAVVRSARTDLLPLREIPARAGMVWDVLEYRLLEPGPLVTPFTQKLLLLLLLTALAGLLWRARPWLRVRAAALLLLAYVLIAAALVWSVGIIMVLAEFWPVPRVMSHVGIFWAGLLVISWQCSPSLARKLLALAAALILLSFIGADNQILREQLRLNARDTLKANRILARLEGLPGFPGAGVVAIYGKAWGYPLRYATMDHDMNISAFGADWSKLAILREVSGYGLQPATDPGQIAAAEAYCRSVQPWPSTESVVLREGVAIVCLDH